VGINPGNPKAEPFKLSMCQNSYANCCGIHWLSSMLALSSVAFLRSKKPIRCYPVFLLTAFIIFGISGFYLTSSNINLKVNATVIPNNPIGEAKGIFPGRVVWSHNPHAVNQNCNPSSYGHAWYMSENNNQPVVDNMVSAAIDSLTGQKSDSAAWRSMFQYHNATRGKGKVNYRAGEKIFIKINSSSSWDGNYNPTDLSKVNNAWYGMSETSPAMVLAVLHQLVDIVHVEQSDIYIGDPMKHIYKHAYEQWHPRYPGVHYLDHDNYAGLGREQAKPSATAKFIIQTEGLFYVQCLLSGESCRPRLLYFMIHCILFLKTPNIYSIFLN